MVEKRSPTTFFQLTVIHGKPLALNKKGREHGSNSSSERAAIP